jgi:hypothetical protein
MPRTKVVVALFVAASLLAPPALARSLSVVVGATGRGPTVPVVRFTILDLRLGDDAFDLGLGGFDGAPSVAASWRRTVAAGPVGTLVIDGRAGGDAGGVGVAAGVRGTVGPVALRLELGAGTRAPTPFTILLRAPATAPPVPDGARLTAAATDGLRADLTAAATWRPDRLWTVEVAPRVHVGAGGWSGGAAVTVRRAAVATDFDLSGRLDVAAGRADGHVGVGLTGHHVPRRAPESRATLWWGGPWGAMAPGIEFVSTTREADSQLTLAAGWGPNWADRARAYGAVAFQTPLGGGNAHLGWRWQAAGPVTIELGWTRPVDR